MKTDDINKLIGEIEANLTNRNKGEMMESLIKCAVYPWIEDDSLMIDVTLNDEDWFTNKISLIRLFNEFMESHRIYGTNDFGIDGQKQIMHMIATLRFIAREMETELEGARL